MYFHKDKMSMQVWTFLQIEENGTNTTIQSELVYLNNLRLEYELSNIAEGRKAWKVANVKAWRYIVSNTDQVYKFEFIRHFCS